MSEQRKTRITGKIDQALSTVGPVGELGTKPHETEKGFTQFVMDLAKWHHWRGHHSYDSRRSAEGYLDCTFLRPPDRLVTELKVPPNRPTISQWEWACAWADCSIDTYLWYPRHTEIIIARLCGRLVCQGCVGTGAALERQRFHQTDPREAWVCRDCGRVYGEVNR